MSRRKRKRERLQQEQRRHRVGFPDPHGFAALMEQALEHQLAAEPAAKPAAEPVMFTECAIGYRQWKIDAFGRLWPQSRARPWVPGVNVAECLPVLYPSGWPPGSPYGPPGHAVPHVDCECGLYARFDLDATISHEARDRLSTFKRDAKYPAFKRDAKYPALIAMPLVLGAVASWGRMMVHADGMRAEKACVLALAIEPTMPPEVAALVEKVAAAYRVPAVPLRLLELEASQHGTPLPDSVKPKPPQPLGLVDFARRSAQQSYYVPRYIPLSPAVAVARIKKPDGTP